MDGADQVDQGRRGYSRRLEAAIAARNQSLRLASQSWGDLSPGDRAKMTARSYGRYRCGPWRWARDRAECPHPVGSVAECFWAAGKALDRDVGERQMRRILA